jgi:HlyD family secretion protein
MKKKFIIAVAVSVLFIIGIGVAFAIRSHGHRAEQMIVDGTIECDEINVSSKVPGRILDLFVDEGMTVTPGELLVTLESKEIDAKVEQTAAAYQSSLSRVSQAGTALKFQELSFSDQLAGAQAQYDARKEEIRQAEENLNQAKANYKTQTATYNRFHGLYADGVVPKQTEDDYEYKYLAAKAMLGAAESKVEEARHGLKAAAAALQQARDSSLQVDLRQQEHSAVIQQAAATKGQMNEALALQGETRILSPVNGYVSEKISNVGEMVAPGFPMLTIVRANDFKAKVYVDESKFGYLQIGDRIKVIVPALGNQGVWGRLMRVSQAADFATKRATNEQGTFDVRGLQLVIHLDDDRRFRNGMTARVVLDVREK